MRKLKKPTVLWSRPTRKSARSARWQVAVLNLTSALSRFDVNVNLRPGSQLATSRRAPPPRRTSELPSTSSCTRFNSYLEVYFCDSKNTTIGYLLLVMGIEIYMVFNMIKCVFYWIYKLVLNHLCMLAFRYTIFSNTVHLRSYFTGSFL